MNLFATMTLDADRFNGPMGRSVLGLNSLMGGLRGIIAPLAAVTAGIVGAAGAVGLLQKSSSEAAGIEDLQTSFVTLLGSVGDARDRISELEQFAASTPFQIQGIAAASRTLETLTRGSLSTGDGLRMVGDLAAATNQPFQDLAVHVGRLYDGLQSGRAVGESLSRLQELGIISGDVRGEIEVLQKEGAKGDEVWGVAAAAFGRFAGEIADRGTSMG
ncbi:hypothetical protein [Cerasicoccus maritimus]|uniref:hypothetical protein n=1 Tax=Cerasicoccus maritimus TaxID=490089 RepID=UPI002852A225|nr:hypothetical protein [Cerasicoccus maritimus]